MERKEEGSEERRRKGSLPQNEDVVFLSFERKINSLMIRSVYALHIKPLYF